MKLEESEQPTGTQEGLERVFGLRKLGNILRNTSWCKESFNLPFRLLNIFEYIENNYLECCMCLWFSTGVSSILVKKDKRFSVVFQIASLTAHLPDSLAVDTGRLLRCVLVTVLNRAGTVQ